MKILLGDMIEKLVRETVFRLTILKFTVLLCWDIYLYIWTSDDGKTHSHMDHILIGRGWHSSIGLLDESSFSGADCDTGHYPVAAVFGVEIWQVNEQCRNFIQRELISIS